MLGNGSAERTRAQADETALARRYVEEVRSEGAEKRERHAQRPQPC